MSTVLQHQISDLSKTCIRRMKDVETEFRHRGSPDSMLSSPLVSDGFDRFKLWAGNIGAIHVPNRQDSSLDQRLKEAPTVADEVIACLKALIANLDDVWQITSGQRQNRVGTMEFYEDVYDENGPTGAVTAEVEELSEVFEIFQTTQTTISCLFRLSHAVRRSTKRDRYATSYRKREDPYDEAFDIAHVGHKFPKLRETAWLETRLGRAIARRREFIRYSKEHHQRQGKGLKEVEQEQAPLVTVEHALVQDEKPALLPSAAGPSHQFQSSLGSTTASTLDPAQLMVSKDVPQDALDDDQATESSYATTEITSENEGALKVPPIPEEGEGGKEFECPYCWIVLSLKGNSNRRRKYWKEHVFQDLRPYVCTFPTCDLLMFPDSDSWFKHELDSHRAEWSCLFCFQKTFDSSEKYERHLKGQHEQLIENTHISTLLKTSEQAVKTIKPSSCPFCNPEVGDENLPIDAFRFKIHVARHMQQLALFALPRVSDIGEESWESDKAAVLNPETVDEVEQGSAQQSTEPSDPPMHLAAYEGNGVEIMRMLRGGNNIDAAGSTWGTVMGAAIAGGHPAVVKLLVDSGVDLHLPCKLNGKESTTVLQAAAAKANPSIEEILGYAVSRINRLSVYSELTWKLEIVATKLETLQSRYERFSTHDLYSNNVMIRAGYEHMEFFASQSSRLGRYLRTIGTNLDSESDKADASLKNVFPYIHLFLNGLEVFHDLVDFLLDYFYVDTTESGPLSLAAHHCISHFNDSIIQTIRTKDITDFLHECESIADSLSRLINKAPQRNMTSFHSSIIEDCLKVEKFTKEIYAEVRYDFQRIDDVREDRLRYYNTYPMEPEVFHRLRTLYPVPEREDEYYATDASERAAVDIPALVRASTRKLSKPGNLPTNLLRTESDIRDGRYHSDSEQAPTPAYLGESEVNPGFNVSTDDNDEPHSSSTEALQRVSRFVVDIGKNALERIMHAASSKRLLTVEEKLGPMNELWDQIHEGLELLRMVIADYEAPTPDAVASESENREDLIDMCNKLQAAYVTLRQQLEIEATKEIEDDPVHAYQLKEFYANGKMAGVLESLMSTCIDPIMTALHILHRPQSETPGNEDAKDPPPPLAWNELMEHFEWRAGCSLSHMLNDYLLCCTPPGSDEIDKGQSEVQRAARERLRGIVERQKLFQ